MMRTTPFRTEGRPAPGELEIVHGFLNTWSDELGIEDFATARSTEQWLRRAGLWQDRRRLTDAEADTVRAFRDALRRLLSCRTDPERMAALEPYAARAELGLTFSSGGAMTLIARGEGTDRVIGRLLAVIHTSMIDGTWDRLKCCALESCRWTFYDTTRNHSGRWCSMKTCGSRHKAREYLKRKARG